MIVTLALLCEICHKLRKLNNKIVFTNGCFDILHAGHVTYLEAAKKLGDILIVGLNSDISVRKLKGETRPVNSQVDRGTVLSALRAIDYVIIFDEDTPLKLIEQIMPDILTKGGDYTPNTIVGAEFVQQKGGEVIVIPLVKGKSTTSILQKINSL